MNSGDGRPRDAHKNRLAPEFFRFAHSDLIELKALLGSRFETASHGLKIGAWAYLAQKEGGVSGEVKAELRKVERGLFHAGKAIDTLSADARRYLASRFDWDASIRRNAYVSVIETLTEFAMMCRQAQLMAAKIRSCSRVAPGELLAAGVAGGFAAAGIPIAKSRDGLFARVLTIVWSAVDVEHTPEEIFPYLQRAATLARSSPELRARIGRPKKRKLV